MIIITTGKGRSARQWGGGKSRGHTALCFECAWDLDKTAAAAVVAELNAYRDNDHAGNDYAGMQLNTTPWSELGTKPGRLHRKGEDDE